MRRSTLAWVVVLVVAGAAYSSFNGTLPFEAGVRGGATVVFWVSGVVLLARALGAGR